MGGFELGESVTSGLRQAFEGTPSENLRGPPPDMLSRRSMSQQASSLVYSHAALSRGMLMGRLLHFKGWDTPVNPTPSFLQMEAIMTQIIYKKESYTQGPIKFTPTGHVDMDDFDESGETITETIMTFDDPEVEELVAPDIDKLRAYFTEQNNERPEADEVDVVRKVVEPSVGKKAKPLDIEFFWKEFIDLGMGFNPDDYGWDETDSEGKPYQWNTDELFKQVPKHEDFLKVCQKEIAHEMEWATKDLTEFGVDEAYDIVHERLEQFLKLSRNLYQQEADREWMMYEGML